MLNATYKAFFVYFCFAVGDFRSYCLQSTVLQSGRRLLAMVADFSMISIRGRSGRYRHWFFLSILSLDNFW